MTGINLLLRDRTGECPICGATFGPARPAAVRDPILGHDLGGFRLEHRCALPCAHFERALRDVVFAYKPTAWIENRVPLNIWGDPYWDLAECPSWTAWLPPWESTYGR